MAEIKFLTDEDLRDSIFRGIQRRLPELDIFRVQDVGLRTFHDKAILEFAAQENRIVISQDISTMPDFAISRLKANLPMPGLLIVRGVVPVGIAIEEIVTIAICSDAEEWIGQIKYLPL